jgi:hypothetical protein
MKTCFFLGGQSDRSKLLPALRKKGFHERDYSEKLEMAPEKI